ncbi:endonuclease NucS domain-containing protein, partial [Frederiksenia canicola]
TCKIFIPQINEFLKNILESNEKSGTLIILTNLKLKKSISVDQLIQSIGQRFTVTIGRPDFRININNTLITEDNALPQWELRIPESGVITDRVCVDGREKEIQYWIGFVKEATWPTEHAGIGVYAHGKIAQDRPFFFKVEGREILSRYMYGVIEADLVEELEEDLISTDRTSINWENSSFENFFTKGQEITKNALKQYLEHRQNSEKDKNHQRIKKISEMEKYKLSSQEKVYLGELLNDITPKLGKDEDKIEELTKILAKSWLNEPSRRVVKNLWIDVEKEENLIQLQSTLMKLSDELIPQSLSLTRTFAQRVFALTKLQERIADGKETPLQLLLEDFPWILSHSYEKLTKRQSLTTVIKSAEAQGKIAHRQIALQKGETKPDFVFLSSANEDEMLIIELKNNEPVEFPEFDQLRSYVEYLHLTYPATKIQGILIASDVSTQIQEMIKNHHLLEFMTWDYLLKKSRQEYITFLTALLLGTDESPQEAIEWGGKEVEEFLHDIAKNDLEIKKLMERYNS